MNETLCKFLTQGYRTIMEFKSPDVTIHLVEYLLTKSYFILFSFPNGRFQTEHRGYKDEAVSSFRSYVNTYSGE